ncbi:hypothetical protein CLV35_1773 [Motilibacter peucedani]|uniref:Uncharacterized protein n=1 Tax=Motilibacter peucedani TaxID=598650 RepID=A0A420XPW4_9ACTN|nr:hypothetical protein [Motilibacter peucedani]RKS75313.1 hypothetical protein CLV35_1773 [Motilibacter peucedani]
MARTHLSQPLVQVLAVSLTFVVLGGLVGVVSDGDVVDSVAGFVCGVAAVIAVGCVVCLALQRRAARAARDRQVLDDLEPLRSPHQP